jgi:hypothetical protein
VASDCHLVAAGLCRADGGIGIAAGAHGGSVSTSLLRPGGAGAWVAPWVAPASAAREALLTRALAHGAVELVTGGLFEGLGTGMHGDALAKLVGGVTARLVETAK